MSKQDLERNLARVISDARCHPLSSQALVVTLENTDYYVLLIFKSGEPPKVANDDELDRPWMRPFLGWLRQGLEAQTAAELAGVHRSSVYKWRDKSAAFREAWDAVRVEIAGQNSTREVDTD